MSTDYLPGSEAELVTWLNTFGGLISTGFATYGLTSAQAADYGTLKTAFIDAYNLAKGDGTRTPAIIVAKDEAKKAVITNVRTLVRIIQGNPAVTNEQRTELGITVRKTPASRPVPADAPATDIKSVNGRTVRIRLHDSVGGLRRGKPPLVAGATIFTFIGTSPPADPTLWTFQGNTTRTTIDVTFPDSTPPGAQVWFTAFWRNERDEAGPASAPISTNLAGSGVASVG
jgi:hypothetical protein